MTLQGQLPEPPKLVFWAGVLIIIALLSSCTLTKQQRIDNKVVRKIEKIKKKYPDSFVRQYETIRIDTVLLPYMVVGSGRVDTIEIEKFLTEYVHDTVDRIKFIEKFLEASKDSVYVDTLDIEALIKGSAIEYWIKKKQQQIEKTVRVEKVEVTKTEVIRRHFFQDWKFWLIVAGLLAIIILDKLGKIKLW